jgi:ribonuclease D
VPKLLDLQNMYKKIRDYGERKSGLAVVCNYFFCKPLCKKEQCSNWEQRPLTNAQLHYAALDAWILV